MLMEEFRFLTGAVFVVWCFGVCGLALASETMALGFHQAWLIQYSSSVFWRLDNFWQIQGN